MTDIALVTGGTRGIGAAIARSLKAEGHEVAVVYHGNDAAAARFKQDTGISVFKWDVADEDACREGVAQVEERLGPVSVLVNNAGMQFVAPVEDFPTQKWDMIIALNLTAAFHTIRHAVPVMRKKKWGRIIATASAHSLVASPFKSAYVTAKHGLAGLTKTVALEVADAGITVNCISPGYVWTPLVENQIPDTMRARGMTREQVINDVLLAGQPTKQFVTVEQVAAIASFLTRDEAANITGANLSVDVGWTAA